MEACVLAPYAKQIRIPRQNQNHQTEICITNFREGSHRSTWLFQLIQLNLILFVSLTTELKQVGLG